MIHQVRVWRAALLAAQRVASVLLPMPPRPVHGLHDHSARPGQGRVQPGQFSSPAHEQPRPFRQVRQPRWHVHLGHRRERLRWQHRYLLSPVLDVHSPIAGGGDASDIPVRADLSARRIRLR